MLSSLIVKIALVLFLFFIIFNLAKALFYMVKGDNAGQPISHYLGRRVFTSALVVVLILLAFAFGIIEPNPRPY
ncbi:DUF2909 domain-containing protein [Vibrio profundi]|uniref:DUF2909 domain-containing protein n=1 Tax=Vibrio profundi TaxID=1774960 RepID=UPI00373580D0